MKTPKTMYSQLEKDSVGSNHGVFGFEAIQEIEYESGLVEGIGYRNGQLVRYSAGSHSSSPFECEPMTMAEALHWWADLQGYEEIDSSTWRREARARFLEDASQAVTC